MIIRNLIESFSRVTLSGSADVEVSRLSASSSDVGPGVLYAAIRGTTVDGHKYISDALEAGAVAILAESAPPLDLDPKVAWLHVPNSRKALSEAASVMAEHPWKAMSLAGVTGTNGKTTTTFLIHHFMKSAWHRAGLLGTIQVDDGETVQTAKHTTPGSIELSEHMLRMKDHGCRGLAMEVSSHGIDQSRVSAIGFDACVFTNLTQDHLDYHGSIEAYFQTKAQWFHDVAADPRGKKPVAIINIDDPYGAELAAALEGKIKIIRFGFGVHAEFRANNFRQNSRGMEFELSVKGRTFLVRAPYIGRFNVYNLLAAIAAAHACGIRPRECVAALVDAPQVPGRMENVGNAGGATVFVDYAHTPDALENACRTLKELEPRRLITVFGCGGDRDATKRPLMGAAVTRYADACIVTSDNPRSEDPLEIIRQIEVGMNAYGHLSIPNREEAIQHAVKNALSGDIILIAGKGHESTQQFAETSVDFDDRKKASKALRERAKLIAESR